MNTELGAQETGARAVWLKCVWNQLGQFMSGARYQPLPEALCSFVQGFSTFSAPDCAFHEVSHVRTLRTLPHAATSDRHLHLLV